MLFRSLPGTTRLVLRTSVAGSAGAEAVLAVVVQGQSAVAPFHAGTAALEEVGAFSGDSLDVSAQVLGECLQWGVGATQRFEQFL